MHLAFAQMGVNVISIAKMKFSREVFSKNDSEILFSPSIYHLVIGLKWRTDKSHEYSIIYIGSCNILKTLKGL